MDLEQLKERYPKWDVSQTPGGVYVARRKRHMVLTHGRIDGGFRDCLIEKTIKLMETQLSKQESLEESLQTNGV